MPLTKKYVTMQEYYAYRLQQHENKGQTLILGRRLRQQFLVDAYTCIEEYRLIWVRNHQLQLRSEVYFGIKDVVFRVVPTLLLHLLGKELFFLQALLEALDI